MALLVGFIEVGIELILVVLDERKRLQRYSLIFIMRGVLIFDMTCA